MKNLLKNKKLVIIGSIVILIILFIILMSVLSHGKSVYGDRCSDSSSYKLSKKTIKKTENTIKTIVQINPFVRA